MLFPCCPIPLSINSGPCHYRRIKLSWVFIYELFFLRATNLFCMCRSGGRNCAEHICCRERGESFGIESWWTVFSPWTEKKYKEEFICVCENLPTCGFCCTTVGNPQMHWKFVVFLEECPLPALSAFFSPVSDFYFGSFVQVHAGS